MSDFTAYIQNGDRNTLMYDHELETRFDEYVNEVYGTVEVMEMTFTTSDVLKTDSGAYRESFLGWMNSNGWEMVD